MVLCRSPPLWRVESASGGNSQDEEMETQRGRRRTGALTETGGASVLPEDEGRVERSAGGMLARGVDVQLALENVVDDRLGQVIHHVAVPVLQGQPGREDTGVRGRLP